MSEIFLIAADYLKGKSVYPPIRRALDFLLNISIASFVYEKCYGQYTWLNYNDYKGMLNFLIKGEFFIPFSVFIAVYGITYFLAQAIFAATNHFKTLKWTRQILYYEIKKRAIDQHLKDLDKVSKKVSPVRLTKPLMIELFNELKNHLTPEAYQNLETALKQPKQDLEANFHTAFRLLIAITIYFISLPQFGWLLFLIVVITLAISMYLILLASCFLDILPALVRRMQSEAEKYILAHQQDQAKKM